MVLDIDSFRPQEDPEALGPDGWLAIVSDCSNVPSHPPVGVRDIQRKRFKNVEVVQEISDVDEEWRAMGFKADMYNKAKNVISKAIGAKMKVFCAQNRHSL
jgi:hypothetical protein